MELTNRHRLLLGVVGVGVAAVAVDRFVLNGSAPASAGAAPAVVANAPAQQAPAQPAVADGAADRLQRLAEVAPAPTPENEAKAASAFTAPVNWLPETERKAAATAGTIRSSRESELAERFHLTSVFTIGAGYATINGVKVEVGKASEELGLKLLSIQPPAHRGPAEAVVEYRGQQFRLETQYGVSKQQGSTRK